MRTCYQRTIIDVFRWHLQSEMGAASVPHYGQKALNSSELSEQL